MMNKFITFDFHGFFYLLIKINAFHLPSPSDLSSCPTIYSLHLPLLPALSNWPLYILLHPPSLVLLSTKRGHPFYTTHPLGNEIECE